MVVFIFILWMNGKPLKYLVYAWEFEFFDSDGIELPAPDFGHEPRHGGKIIAVAVSRELADIPAVTAANAARILGVSSARVSQLINAGLLDSWKDGTK